MQKNDTMKMLKIKVNKRSNEMKLYAVIDLYSDYKAVMGKEVLLEFQQDKYEFTFIDEVNKDIQELDHTPEELKEIKTKYGNLTANEEEDIQQTIHYLKTYHNYEVIEFNPADDLYLDLIY